MTIEQDSFDNSSHPQFVDYYAKVSVSTTTLKRMKGICDSIVRKLNVDREGDEKLDVADIGCGAGTMSLLWAREGYKVHGLDISEELLNIAKERAAAENLVIDFVLGSATKLPWDDATMDVCVAPELLEHVKDWKSCLDEFARVLKPKGVLFISTSNKLCPKQHEFNLPFYSWYPSSIKRYYENLAITTRPDIANYAKYPAVNWFSFYQLRNEMDIMGFNSFDRFDIMDLSNKSELQKFIISLIKQFSLLRWLGHIASSGLAMISVKRI